MKQLELPIRNESIHSADLANGATSSHWNGYQSMTARGAEILETLNNVFDVEKSKSNSKLHS